MLAGCTFLISFDDVPRDGGADVTLPPPAPPDPPPPPEDIGDASFDGPAIRDASRDANLYADACTGHQNGKYCNGNVIVVDGGSRDDLIICDGGGATIKACNKGTGCVRLPPGFPDECDECQGRAAGQYCGDDFPGWDKLNAKARIRCTGGGVSGSLICTNACIGTGPNASCQ
jgi:hypothetical protein